MWFEPNRLSEEKISAVSGSLDALAACVARVCARLDALKNSAPAVAEALERAREDVADQGNATTAVPGLIFDGGALPVGDAVPPSSTPAPQSANV